MVEEEHVDKGTRNNDSTSNFNENDKRSEVPDRQDAKFQEVKEVPSQATPQFQKSAPILENVGQYHSVVDCNNHVGRYMEQLISRMSQIEDICLRFEEKMVRPISSMEERLQRVENQLEVIVKNTQASELHSCTRFSAPAFSSLDSTSSSFYNDGCANPAYVPSEVEKHEPPFNDKYKSSEEDCKSERAPQLSPSYVVTAPEFSCDEDDEQNDAVEPLKDSSSEKLKKPMSIDEALAAALSGFSSLTISEPPRPAEKVTKVTNEENDSEKDSKCTPYPVDRAFEFTNEVTAGEKNLKHTQGLKFTAPDFASEDTSYDDNVLTPKIEEVNPVNPSKTFATDGGENTLDINSAPSNGSALEKEETILVPKDNVSEQFCEGHSDRSSFCGANNSPSVRAKDYWATGETSMRESRSSNDKLSVLDRSEIVEQLLAKTKDGVGNAETISGPISKFDERGSVNDILSVQGKDDYLATGETSKQESSSSKDKEIMLNRFEILKQLLAKTKDGVDTAEEISGLNSKWDDERGSSNKISSVRAEDDYQATGETSSSSRKNELLKMDRFEILKQLLAETRDGVGSAEKISGPISECDERASGNNISSLLDSETSIFEVKFTSQEYTSSILPLEDLLTDPEVNSQISIAQQSKEGEITTKETDPTSVVNEENMLTAERNNSPLVDLESFDVPVCSENAAGHQDPFGNKEHEVFSSLI